MTKISRRSLLCLPAAFALPGGKDTPTTNETEFGEVAEFREVDVCEYNAFAGKWFGKTVDGKRIWFAFSDPFDLLSGSSSRCYVMRTEKEWIVIWATTKVPIVENITFDDGSITITQSEVEVYDA